MLERDVRYLDSRIALLIQNRMGGEEVSMLREARIIVEVLGVKLKRRWGA